jgi:hypothetical protein
MQLEVVEHLNESHRKDLLEIAQAFGDATWATDATLERFDFAGLDLRAHHGPRNEPRRVDFATPAEEESGIEDCFLDLLDAAREKLGVRIITSDVIGSASHDLPFSNQTIFAAICAVRNYPDWLPPIGEILETSHESLVEGSSFTAQVRGQHDAVMQIDVLEFQQDLSLYWYEREGHAHAIRFALEPLEPTTRLTVSVSNRVPIPESELEETQQKLSKLSETIAKKLEAQMRQHLEVGA